MAQSSIPSPPNISVKRRRYDVESNSGYLEVEVNGSAYTLKIYRSPRGKGVIVELDGLYETLSRLKKLLKSKGLEGYAEIIEQYIRSTIYEAELRSLRKHKVLIMKSVQLKSGTLDVGLRDDGKFVIRYGGRRVVAAQDNILEKVSEVVPIDDLDPQLADQIKRVFNEFNQSIVTGKEILVLMNNDAISSLLPSIAIDNKLVLIIPFVSSYSNGDMVKKGVLSLVVVSDANGNVEGVKLVPNPVEVEVGGKVFYKDFLERIAFSEVVERLLPPANTVNKIRAELAGGKSVTFSEALDLVNNILDKYAYVEGGNRTIAALYAVAQVFYDLVPLFPILRIIGEMGSGKRQLANAIAACSPIAITVVKPSEASLYRIVDAFHPLLIIDESKINEDVSLLLNAGFEKDRFVPRSRVVEDGRVTIDLFNFYSPKIIVSRPGALNLPDDTVSRTIEVYMQRVSNKAFPLEVDPKDHEEAVVFLLVLKVRKWWEFFTFYNALRNTLIDIDPRTRDTYLPLLTVAYLISKEKGDPTLFIETLKHMVESSQERAGTPFHQRVTVVGILKHVAASSTLSGKVKAVSVTVKDIEGSLGVKVDMNTKVRIGKFLNEAPFKVSKSRSGGYTKYVVDVEKVYNYVRNYNVDISLLTDDELDKLEKLTDLNWRGIGFNKDEWMKNVMAKLFGEISGGNPPEPSTPPTPYPAPRKAEGALGQGEDHSVEGPSELPI